MLILDEELPHQLQVSDRESPPKFLGQPARKLTQQLSTILRPLLALLLMLHDAAADLEVREHLKSINDGRHATAGGLDEAANLGDERGEVAGLGLGDDGSFGSGFLFHRVRALGVRMNVEG